LSPTGKKIGGSQDGGPSRIPTSKSKAPTPAMSALFNGEISIVGAFITKQISVEGAIGDALGAKVLLEAVRVY